MIFSWTNMWITISGILLSGFLWTGEARADQAQKAHDLLSDLHHANQMEIQMGKMAKEKGTSEQVRQYGDRLIQDHELADQKVQDLARKDGVTLAAPSHSGVFERIAASKEHRVMK